MASVEVTGLDDRLYEALRLQAAMDNRSVSQEVAAILQGYFAHLPQEAAKANEAFLSLVGTWKDDRTAEEIISDIRNARQSGLRFFADSNVFD